MENENARVCGSCYYGGKITKYKETLVFKSDELEKKAEKICDECEEDEEDCPMNNGRQCGELIEQLGENTYINIPIIQCTNKKSRNVSVFDKRNCWSHEQILTLSLELSSDITISYTKV